MKTLVASIAIICVSSIATTANAGYYVVSYEQTGTSTEVGPHGGTSNSPYYDSGDGGRAGVAFSEDYWPLVGDGAWWTGRPGSASCQASIKAHFTWTPESINDEQPPCVIIYQTATASWSGDSGSASDGLGGTYTATSSGGSSIGHQIEVVIDPAEEFDRTCTPTASASVGSVYTSPDYASASAYYRAEAYAPYVALTNTKDTNHTIVGQTTGASLLYTSSHWGPTGLSFIDPGITFSNYTWEVPGETFKQFYVSSTQDVGHVVTMDAADWLVAHPAWIWRDEVVDENIIVTATPSIAGVTAIGQVLVAKDINVTRPTYLFGATPGDNRYYRNGVAGISGDIIGGSAGDMVTKGITFTSTVTAPTSYTGSACFAQLVYRETSNMNATTGPTTPDYYLDTQFPYRGTTWTANGSPHTDGDGPLDALPDPYICTSFHHDWHFETWLMFKPAGSGDWTPLKRVDWRWKEDFDQVSGAWPAETTLGQPSVVSSGDTRVHPHWDHKDTGSGGG